MPINTQACEACAQEVRGSSPCAPSIIFKELDGRRRNSKKTLRSILETSRLLQRNTRVGTARIKRFRVQEVVGCLPVANSSRMPRKRFFRRPFRDGWSVSGAALLVSGYSRPCLIVNLRETLPGSFGVWMKTCVASRMHTVPDSSGVAGYVPYWKP